MLLHTLQQSQGRLLFTVVDNSADDSLRAQVEASGANYLFSGRNVGFGAGHNLALRRTLDLAPYQAVINPDVAFAPDTFLHLQRFMESHPQVGQLMPAILYPDGSEQRLAKRLPSPFDLFLRRFLGRLGRYLAPERWDLYETRDLDLSVARQVPSLSGCFMFLRSSVLQQTGLFDERYFMYMEDVDLCRRIGEVSQTVMLPDVSIVHGYGKGSYKSLRLLLFHLQSAVRYFQKWGWIFDSQRDLRNARTGAIERLAEDHEVFASSSTPTAGFRG